MKVHLKEKGILVYLAISIFILLALTLKMLDLLTRKYLIIHLEIHPDIQMLKVDNSEFLQLLHLVFLHKF